MPIRLGWPRRGAVLNHQVQDGQKGGGIGVLDPNGLEARGS
ncbi:MAG TPA: hypothetical protein VKU02_17785 [Gemmataceae bacterium]|nr:hypothetical protein [Gemmataceae bacterium]